MTQEEILDRAKTIKIAIIGDLIQDNYIIGDVKRVSPEAPVVVVSKTSEHTYLGGAGNVFMNLRNLGIDVYLFSIGSWKGNPDVESSIFLHPGTTPIKTRVMSDNHHLLRIDEEDDKPSVVDYDDLSWREDFEKLLSSIDCLIFSDYHKGTISTIMATTIISMCNEKGIPVMVDAKRDFRKYQHILLLKCNHHEAKEYVPDILRQDLNMRYFVVTEGANGVRCYFQDCEERIEGIDVGVVDVCGAGDTIIAITALAFTAGCNVSDSLQIANKAAAEVCKHSGVYAIRKEDFIKL